MIKFFFSFVALVAMSEAIKYVKISEPYVPEIFEKPNTRTVTKPYRLGHGKGDDRVRPSSTHRNAIKRPNRKWASNTIPYAYATKYPQAMIDIINGAMKAIEDNTCIKFVEQTDEQDFIVFAANPDGSSCNAVLGYRGNGYQIVYLSNTYGRGTCLVHHVVVHELMHAIGLDHEQNRSDRDKYITVYFENIETSPNNQTHNFEKVDDYQFFDYGCPYTYTQSC